MARSGILPSPKELEEYESIMPGVTDRLLKIVENQQEHRIELEKSVIGVDSKRMLRGQIFAFIMASISIVGGLLLLFTRKEYSWLFSPCWYYCNFDWSFYLW